ncbi:crossover junction endodeoxyribonuclease RuvC [Candidatus Parcubacteria bacterium]|nr:crossover junction endodeoxyribonuclease RuvC [Candidatus Parcubacteria bacterium]
MKKSKTFIPMQSSIVLGIDPGFDRIGIAILSRENSKEKLLYSACISTNRKENQSERLAHIGREVKKIISEWRPTELCIEKLFFNQNITTALRVAEARGVILYEAEKAGLLVFEYNPQQIKIAVTGYGKAAKRQMQDMTMKLLGIRSKPKFDDEADAWAVALTHLAHQREIIHKTRG